MQPMQHKHICVLPLVFKCGVQTTAKAAKAAKSQQLAANFGMLTWKSKTGVVSQVAIAAAIRDLTVTIQHTKMWIRKNLNVNWHQWTWHLKNIYVSHFLQRYMRGHAYTENQEKNMCLVLSLPRKKQSMCLVPSLPRQKIIHVFGSKFATPKKNPCVWFQVCHAKKISMWFAMQNKYPCVLFH